MLKPVKASRNATPYVDPSLDQFTRQIKAIRSRLQPYEAGRRDGEQNKPPVSASAPAGWELDTMGEYREALGQICSYVKERFSRFKSELQRLESTSPEEPDLQQIQNRLTAKLGQEEGKHARAVVEAAEKANDKKRLLNSFRDANRLTRDAAPTSTLFAVVIALGAFMGDAIVNYAMLWGQSAGSAGSILLIVFMPAILCAVMGLLIGFFGIRNLLHVKTGRKVAGALITLGLGALILYLFTFFANYRATLDTVTALNLTSPEALDQQRAAAFRNIAGATFERPFGFTSSFLAVVYMAVSIGLLAIAVVEGVLVIHDRYPKYTDVTKEYALASEALDEARSRFYAAIEAAHDEGIHQCEKATAEARQWADSITTIFDGVTEYLHRHTMIEAIAINECASVTLEYRKKNREIRGNQGPAYFADAFQFIGIPVPSPFDYTEEKMEGISRRVLTVKQAVEKRSQAIIDRLREDHGRYLEELHDREKIAAGEQDPSALARAHLRPSLYRRK